MDELSLNEALLLELMDQADPFTDPVVVLGRFRAAKVHLAALGVNDFERRLPVATVDDALIMASGNGSIDLFSL